MLEFHLFLVWFPNLFDLDYAIWFKTIPNTSLPLPNWCMWFSYVLLWVGLMRINLGVSSPSLFIVLSSYLILCDQISHFYSSSLTKGLGKKSITTLLIWGEAQNVALLVSNHLDNINKVCTWPIGSLKIAVPLCSLFTTI